MNVRKKRYIMLLLLVGIVAYILLFPRPLGRELLAWAEWTTDIANGSTPERPLGQEARYAFELGERIGYIDEGGGLVASYAILHGAALGDSFFLNYSSAPDTLLVKEPDGSAIGALRSEGYPFIKGNRIFVLSADMTGLSEWTPRGELLWQRRFSSIVTAVAAGATTTVVGIDTGSAMVLGSGGNRMFETTLRGSRLPVILSAAVSADDRYVALVSGIDPEKLTLLEKSGSAGYRDVTQYLLPGDYRRHVQSRFVGSSSYLLVEQPDAIGLFHPTKRTSAYIPLQGRVFELGAEMIHGMLSVAVTAGDRFRVMLFLPDGNVIFDFEASMESDVFFRSTADGFIFGRGTRLYRVAVSEG